MLFLRLSHDAFSLLLERQKSLSALHCICYVLGCSDKTRISLLFRRAYGTTIEGQILLLLLFVALIVMLLALKAKSKEKEIGILVKRTKSFSWPLQKIT